MQTSHRFVTMLCALIMLVFGMMLTVLGPLLIEIAGTFKLGLAQTGLIFSVNFLGFVIFVLLGGIVGDHVGKKPVLTVALGGLALSMLMVALAPNQAVLFVGMFLLGGFGGVLEVMTSSFISEINPDRSHYALNRLQIFFGIGAVMGPVGASCLVVSGLSWTICYLVLGAAALVLTLAFLSVRGAVGHPQAGFSIGALKNIAQDGRFLLICLAMFLYTGSEVGSWGWLSTYLKSTLQFDLLMAGIATSLFWLAMTVGRVICGRLTSRFSLGLMIPVLAGLSFAASLLTGLVASPAIAWVLVIAFGFVLSSQWPFIVSYGSAYRQSSSGTEFALLVGSGGLGSTVLPWLMGMVGEAWGMRWSMAVPTLGLAVLALLFVWFGIRKRPVGLAR
jgi:fucose permease